MLPLCDAAAAVARYAEEVGQYKWGLVAQALAAALRGVLADWR